MNKTSQIPVIARENWTEEQFQVASAESEMSTRTLLACHDVLVNGVENCKAAEIHGVPRPSISRGITKLVDRFSEAALKRISSSERKVAALESAVELQELMGVMKSDAVRLARMIAGPGLQVEDAVHGQNYEGPGIYKSDAFLVQRVGTRGVVHDLGKIGNVLETNSRARLLIEYPKSGGLAKVSEIDDRRQEKDRRGGGVER